jgi:hypothetical protein
MPAADDRRQEREAEEVKNRAGREAAVAEPRSSMAGLPDREGFALPPDDPERILGAIRELVATDFSAARRMASEAASRFPEHRDLQEANRVLNAGRAKVVRRSQGISHQEEFRWLQAPPVSMRGKWVALVGTAVVAAADSLQELSDSLGSRHFAKLPLVHRVD